MKRLKYLITFFGLIICYKSNAVEGCLVANRMYTSSANISILSGPAFTTAAFTDANGRCWTPAPSGTCQVCNGTAVAAAGLLVCVADLFGPRDGAIHTGSYFSSFTLINCNLDDYSIPFVAATGIFGLLVIRKRNKK